MTILDQCAELERAEHDLAACDAGPADLLLAARWLEDFYGQGKFPADFFPKTGVAVRRGGETLAVVPVYLEASSRVAVAGHFTAAPGLPPRLLRKAAQTAVRGCQEFARKRGRPYLVAIWGRRSISRIAEQCGFRNADTVQEQLFINTGV